MFLPILAFCILVMVVGALLAVFPREVTTFMSDARSSLLGEQVAKRMPTINTPRVGGIGMVVVATTIFIVGLTTHFGL